MSHKGFLDFKLMRRRVMSNLSKTNAKLLIVIDSRGTDWQRLIGEVNQNATLLVLDSARDGLTQIAEAVANASNIDAIHIILHGNTGSLLLGSTILDSNNLSDYQTQLITIGNALTEIGDLLLYGCNAAQGDVGQAFIQQLAMATGADVAASNDLTGNAALGGDWLLEASTGNIEASSYSLESYQGILRDYNFDYLLAEMSKIAYYDNPDNPLKSNGNVDTVALNAWNTLKQDGWSLLESYKSIHRESLDFAALAFEKGDQVVIAYRGTDTYPPLGGDWTGANRAIAGLADWDAQFTDALNFAWQVKQDSPNTATIYATGHSLGGALAQVTSQMFGFDGATFDPSGAANVAGSIIEFNNWATSHNFPSQGQGVGTGFLNYLVTDSPISGWSGTHVGNNSEQLDFFAYATNNSSDSF
jgi:hypothetical protein